MTTQMHWRDTVQRFLDEARNTDVIDALGLRKSPPGASAFEMVGMLAAGIVIGAGLTALFSPRSGREIREAIGQRAQELRATVDKRAEDVSPRAGSQH